MRQVRRLAIALLVALPHLQARAAALFGVNIVLGHHDDLTHRQFAGKKMVLIDTAGMAQRDGRTRELLEMLAHRSAEKIFRPFPV